MSNIRQRLKERKAQIAQLVASTVKSVEAAGGHGLVDNEPQTASSSSCSSLAPIALPAETTSTRVRLLCSLLCGGLFWRE